MTLDLKDWFHTLINKLFLIHKKTHSTYISTSINIDNIISNPLSFFLSYNTDLKLFYQDNNDVLYLAFNCIHSIDSREELEHIKSLNLYYFGALSFDNSIANNHSDVSLKKDFFFLPRLIFIIQKQRLTIILNMNKDETISSIQNELQYFISSHTTTHISEKKININPIIEKKKTIKNIEQAISKIKKQELIKVVISTTGVFHMPHDDINTYLTLLYKKNKHGYKYILKQKNNYIFSFSPEKLLTVNNNNIHTVSLAGSILNHEKDEKLYSHKITDENHHVLTYIKNILQKHSTNINISNKKVVKLHNIKHLKYDIYAILKEKSFVPLLLDIHPTPALAGVPKEKSMLYIKNNENTERMWYGGALGVIKGNFCDLFVGIRLGYIFDEKIILYAGAGITKYSEPEKELLEILKKMKFGFF